MKTPLLLRVTSVLMFLYAAGHSLGGRKSWSPAGETDVLRAMRSVSFQVGGATRTYFDFYTGFGWSLSVFMLLQAILLWQVAAIAKSDPSSVQPMIAAFFVAMVALTVISWEFILAVPAIFSAVLAVCLAAAFFTASAASQ